MGLLGLAFWGLGCDPNDPGNAENQVEIDESAYDPDSTSYYVIDTNCCGFSVTGCFSGESRAGGAYYYLALLDGDSIIHYGLPVQIAEGSYTDEFIGLSVNYNDEISPGTYILLLAQTLSGQDVGDENSLVHNNVLTPACTVMSYDTAYCFSHCCTPSQYGLNYYASVGIPISNLIGAKADIKSRVSGILCGEPNSTDHAFGCAFVDVSRRPQGEDDPGWAQTGMTVERISPSNKVYRSRYVESNGDNYYWRLDSLFELVEGTTPTYAVQLDTLTGQWGFYFNGELWRTSPPDGFWEQYRGEQLEFTGEVTHHENDMPGTITDPCTFSNCQYRDLGLPDYDFVNMYNGQYFYSDSTQWLARITGPSTMKILDLNPR
jgi:hypothetical protein